MLNIPDIKILKENLEYPEQDNLAQFITRQMDMCILLGLIGVHITITQIKFVEQEQKQMKMAL